MPISSGALEWPKSYFRKPVDTEADSSSTGEGPEWGWGIKSPRRVAPLNHEWQPKLSAREDYEKWRKEMDRKAPLKSRKKNRHEGYFCCCCGPSMSTKVLACLHTYEGGERESVFYAEKVHKEVVESPAKGTNGDDPRQVIRRRRRRVCCCLTLWLSLLFLLIAAAIVFVFIYFTGRVVLEPKVKLSCDDGRWGVHFMAYKTIFQNGSITYTCCYMPDINKTIIDVQTAKGKSWPDGFLIPNDTCTLSSKKQSCKEYEHPMCTSTPPCFVPSVPPCVACVSCRYQVLLVVLGCLLATIFRY